MHGEWIATIQPLVPVAAARCFTTAQDSGLRRWCSALAAATPCYGVARQGKAWHGISLQVKGKQRTSTNVSEGDVAVGHL
jgi:hypothetical protein